MAWTLCSSGAAITKAGFNENTLKVNNSLSGANLSLVSDESESILCDQARYDLVTNFGSLTANGKQILANLCSNMVAQKIALYLRDEYAGSREFETILDIIENDIRRGLNMIEESKIKTYLGVI